MFAGVDGDLVLSADVVDVCFLVCKGPDTTTSHLVAIFRFREVLSEY